MVLQMIGSQLQNVSNIRFEVHYQDQADLHITIHASDFTLAGDISVDSNADFYTLLEKLDKSGPDPYFSFSAIVHRSVTHSVFNHARGMDSSEDRQTDSGLY